MEYGRQFGGFALPSMTPAVKRLLILNAVVFVLNMVLVGRLSGTASGPGWFALSWDGLWEGYGLGLLRLVTYQFTHGFSDPFHLLFNMLVLYFFGTMAERSLGYRGMYKLYLVSALIGGLAYLAFTVARGETEIPVVGASGACYGIMVYAAATSPHALVIFIIFPIKLWVLAAGLVAIGFYQFYVELVTGRGGNVAHAAHLGGAAWGYLVHRLGWYKDYTPYVYQDGFLAGLRKNVRTWREQRDARSRSKKQAILDQLLEKVHEHGIGSLTPAERRFLDRTSRELKDR